MFLKTKCWVLLCLGLNFWVNAQDNNHKTSVKDIISLPAALDRTKMTPRLPSEERLDDYRSSRDYNYERDAPPPDNPLTRIWNWLDQKIADFLTSSAYEDFWQYVFLAMIAGLVIWLLYKVEFIGGLFVKKSEEVWAYNRITENIHELDFGGLIEEAVAAQNYRLATRLYYLKTLKQLTDKKWIHWQPTKTNRTYLEELQQTSFKEDFERLTFQFEYVWYGEFGVTESQFLQLKEQFVAFSNRL